VIEQEGTPEDVVERPATPFVISFLGTVNIFHGRVEDGRGIFGPLAVEYPVHGDSAPRLAAAYTRPHEFDVSRTDTGSGLWTVLEQVASVGGMVRLELAGAHGGPIHAELGRDQFERLAVQPGDRLYVTPRKVRVFVE
jgi:sulfate transport system ATP-binding protein